MTPKFSLRQHMWRWAIYAILPISGVYSLINSHARPVYAAPADQQVGCVAADQINIMPIMLGTFDRTLTFGGLTRRYTLHLPPGYDAKTALPVVFSLHGFAGSSVDQQLWSGWNTIADRENFIAVYPNGTGLPQRWNAGDSNFIYMGFGAQKTPGQVDDVAFFSALLDELNRTLCIDNARIFVTGLSNGGGMTNRLACELSDRIAAIGTVAGAYSPFPGGCQLKRPMPVMAFHGDADPLVAYTGDKSMNLPPIPQWAAAWAKRNGCDATPTKLPDQGDASGIHYGNCTLNGDVILYTIHGGGHTWPGGQPIPFLGKTSTSISASETMWQFFKAHPMPNQP